MMGFPLDETFYQPHPKPAPKPQPSTESQETTE